jgi:hypothetical protein
MRIGRAGVFGAARRVFRRVEAGPEANRIEAGPDPVVDAEKPAQSDAISTLSSRHCRDPFGAISRAVPFLAALRRADAAAKFLGDRGWCKSAANERPKSRPTC